MGGDGEDRETTDKLLIVLADQLTPLSGAWIRWLPDPRLGIEENLLRRVQGSAISVGLARGLSEGLMRRRGAEMCHSRLIPVDQDGARAVAKYIVEEIQLKLGEDGIRVLFKSLETY